ncbi:Protein of unknown function [Marinobacter daqiaonensis]|uniref:Methylase n=1 Tax=Marinobacter daqiaonensis TaxID=650891 RepID=A0A1I6GN36_9GAMM|nr:DUF938 domain-containing protein [Marinobacter daqiaonensis]SFR43604.1 Protein of unknown function [Marinobacter daqiaonensis]
MSATLPFSQACENNSQPILERITPLLSRPGVVLEIGTGTGQHAEYFARHLQHLIWQPTDHPDNLEICRQRLEQAALANVATPQPLDVSEQPWNLGEFNHAFSANTAHIMSWQEVVDMFHGVAAGLATGGHFCLYGPFRYQGLFTSASNERFDLHLRARASHMGIRDVGDIYPLAAGLGLRPTQDFDMPANNRLLVFTRE